MLKRIGVGYFEIAENGLEAVEKESATEFDLILMDMQVREKLFFVLLPFFLLRSLCVLPKNNKFLCSY